MCIRDRKFTDTRREFQPRANACKNKYGDTVNDITDIFHRWTEQFGDLLGIHNEELSYERREETVILEENEEDDEECLFPSYDKVIDSIKKLKNNKAAGSDRLPGELFKNAGQDFVKEFTHLIVCIWDEEKMTDEWNKGIICLIHTKGDPLSCNNYMGRAYILTKC